MCVRSLAYPSVPNGFRAATGAQFPTHRSAPGGPELQYGGVLCGGRAHRPRDGVLRRARGPQPLHLVPPEERRLRSHPRCRRGGRGAGETHLLPPGATGRTYTPTVEDLGTFLTAEYVPVSDDGIAVAVGPHGARLPFTPQAARGMPCGRTPHRSSPVWAMRRTGCSPIFFWASPVSETLLPFHAREVCFSLFCSLF